MQQNFEKFKKKILKEHAIKSTIYGISCGIIFTAILIIIAKRIPIRLHFIFYIFLGLLLSYLFSSIFYTKLMPKDMTMAKRMDKSLNLKEKVQTMIAYENENGALIELQRKDTEEELQKMPLEKLSMKFSVINFVVAFLAIFALSSSFFVPSKPLKAKSPIIDSSTSNDSSISDSSISSDSTPADSTSSSSSTNLDDWTSDEIDKIKDDVNNSDILDDETKDKINEILDETKDKLEGEENEDKRQEIIDEASKEIENVIDESNSKNTIGENLKQSTDENLSSLGEAIQNGDKEAIQNALDKIENDLLEKNGQELNDALNQIAQEIQDALDKSDAEPGDELYDALEQLKQDLENIANQDTTDEQKKQDISDAFDKAGEGISSAVGNQIDKEALGDQIIESLGNLVKPDGNDKPDDKEDGNGDSNDDNKDDSNDDKEGGASGSGDDKYGSNDSIFTENGYSQYGDVIDDYYGKIVDGTLDGTTPSDLEQILNEYYSTLYNGEKTNNEETN